jgi:hypothetical protein
LDGVIDFILKMAVEINEILKSNAKTDGRDLLVGCIEPAAGLSDPHAYDEFYKPIASDSLKIL